LEKPKRNETGIPEFVVFQSEARRGLGQQLVSAGLAGGECLACSTFLLDRGPVLLLGHNLEEGTDFPGFLCVNKRDVFKVGCRWDELRSPAQELTPALSWISSHGSVTFSSLGRALPDAGLNEAGLAIEEMSLWTSRSRAPAM